MTLDGVMQRIRSFCQLVYHIWRCFVVPKSFRSSETDRKYFARDIFRGFVLWSHSDEGLDYQTKLSDCPLDRFQISLGKLGRSDLRFLQDHPGQGGLLGDMHCWLFAASSGLRMRRRNLLKSRRRRNLLSIHNRSRNLLNIRLHLKTFRGFRRGSA